MWLRAGELDTHNASARGGVGAMDERRAAAGAGTRDEQRHIRLCVGRACGVVCEPAIFSSLILGFSLSIFFSVQASASVSSVEPRNRTDSTETELDGFRFSRTPIGC